MRPRRSARLLALVGAMALVTSGCLYLPAAQEHQETMPDTRPWWCDSTGGGHDDGHGSDHYAGVTKGMLSWDDCLEVSGQLDSALRWAQQYPTVGDAEAAGFHMSVPYVGGMGTHHTEPGTFGPDDYLSPDYDPHNPTFPGTRIDDVFDPRRPEFLQYGGNGDNAELVGMSWYVRTDDGMPPEGFAGDNDWWHVHQSLCHLESTFMVVGEDMSDAQCESIGGINLYLDDYWMVHAWIVPGWEHEPDVFINHHPCLLSSGPADESHSCWDMAHGGH